MNRFAEWQAFTSLVAVSGRKMRHRNLLISLTQRQFRQALIKFIY